jgi:site-specific DNA-methyltransferase (adenine-specific)
MAGHWFGRSQWCLPTEANYEWLRSLFNANAGAFLSRDYASLREEYASLREEYASLREEYEALRRPFAATAETPYTDVWTFRTVQARKGKHPCEKPSDLIRHIIRTSSRPGAVVLDSFTGSGVVGAVALEEGRSFIGSEIDRHWCAVAEARLRAAAPTAQPQQQHAPQEALPLFSVRGAA